MQTTTESQFKEAKSKLVLIFNLHVYITKDVASYGALLVEWSITAPIHNLLLCKPHFSRQIYLINKFHVCVDCGISNCFSRVIFSLVFAYCT